MRSLSSGKGIASITVSKQYGHKITQDKLMNRTMGNRPLDQCWTQRCWEVVIRVSPVVFQVITKWDTMRRRKI